MLKNKQLFMGVVVVVVLILLGGGYFIFSTNRSNTKSSAPQSSSQDESVSMLKPEDIGLQVISRDDKKAVKFVITKADNITGVDYEITYVAKGNVPRGAIGHIDVTSGISQISPNIPDTQGYIVLGTSSSGHYKYDEGVTSVKFVLKITKSDNKLYQVEKTLDL